jgi:hypothetical protein
MGFGQGERHLVEPPRCAVCEDIIGVYEPLVHLGGDVATRSSRALEPEICSSGHCFHLECYERLTGRQ